MEITIRSTDVILYIDGVPVRLWYGVTKNDIPCHVYVHCINVHDDADLTEFIADLLVKAAPTHIGV